MVRDSKKVDALYRFRADVLDDATSLARRSLDIRADAVVDNDMHKSVATRVMAIVSASWWHLPKAVQTKYLRRWKVSPAERNVTLVLPRSISGAAGVPVAAPHDPMEQNS